MMSNFDDVLQVLPSDLEKEPEEKFDFSSPEDVLIEVIVGPEYKEGYSIETCTIINSKDGVSGAATYDDRYGGFLDYMIQSMIDPPKEDGFYVVVGITGTYYRGDGWNTDDDMQFSFVEVRKATVKETREWL